ncbi:MAG: hypothetical protein H7Y38_20270 [Armatimonadetes bacterium]|nr:hypothetical protein [Armatimonadota bacterium]
MITEKFCWLMLAFALWLGAIIPSVYAQEKNLAPAPFRITVSLDRQKVQSGEPVKVSLGFLLDPANNKPTTISDPHMFRWCTFEIVQSNEVVKAWNPDLRATVFLRYKRYSDLDLPSEAPFVVTLPSTVTELPVGDYYLRLRAKVKYSFVVRAIQTPLESAFENTAEETVDVAFSVIPLDKTAMKNRVSKLYRDLGREASKSEQNHEAISIKAYELSVLPPAFAKRAWRSILFDKTISGHKRQRIGQILSTQGTQAMADTLLDVQYTDPIRDEEGKILTLLTYTTHMHGIADDGRRLSDYAYSVIHAHKNSPFTTPTAVDGFF